VSTNSATSICGENLGKFQRNTGLRNLNTRCEYDLHMPNANVVKYQGGVYYTDTKLFSNFPPTNKSSNHDIKAF
jgi:hypothetical protein